jgi:hypothetical protein
VLELEEKRFAIAAGTHRHKQYDAEFDLSANPSTSECSFEKALSWLEELAPNGNLVLPSYNYDFARKGLSAPKSDRSEVGVITEFARISGEWQRSVAPV